MCRRLHGVPVVDVAGFLRVQFDRFSIVQANGKSVVVPDPLDGGEVTGANAILVVGGCELDALAHSPVTLLFSVDGAFLGLMLEMYRVVGNLLSVASLDGEYIL